MKVQKIIALDLVGVALIAAAISFFGCNSDLTISEEQPNETARRETPVLSETVVPDPAPVTAPEAAQLSHEVTFAEAEAAYDKNDFDEAVQLFTEYTEHNSGNPWGHYMLGLSARRAGDSETAETAFTRALELDPKHVKSMTNLSRVLLDTDRPDDALERLYDVFEIDPQSGDAYRLQGRALHQLGDTADAVAAYQEAIRIDASDAWAINNLAVIYIEQGRFEEALSAMARATELRDGVAIFRNNLGMALENTGHFRAAQLEYQAAVDRNENYAVASNNLARVSAVAEDDEAMPVDLGELAEIFVESCERWTVASEPGPAIELDVNVPSKVTADAPADEDLAAQNAVASD